VLVVRVMHFTDTYLPRRDGVITSLRTLRSALSDLGHTSLTVVPAHREQAFEPGLVRLPALACGVADLRLARWPFRNLRPGLLERLASHQADLIHVHTPGPVGLLGVLTAQRLGLPLVQTYHTDLHAYADAYRVPAVALRALARLYARRLRQPAAAPALLPDPPSLLAFPRGTALAGDLAEAAPAFGLTQAAVAGGTAFPPATETTLSECRRAPTARRPARATALDAGNTLLLGGADAVVVPTAAVLERVSLPVEPARVYLVPTGVAAPRATADITDWGIDPEDKVVLFVGRVNREKGIDLLLPAFDRVLAAEPRARLVLVGAVYEPRWLRRMIRSDRVIVTGQQPPEVVAAAYKRADVFAFPSGTDTQALVLQEAALAGVPAVLIDRVLFERGALAGAAVLADRAGFADAILSLLRDPAAAKALGARAARNAARHTPQEFAEAMLAIYGRFVPIGVNRSRASAARRRETPATRTL
jgi:glycosyltransferase involved in cell wall biosynthesis